MSVRPDKHNSFLNNNHALTAEALRESEQWWHLLIKNLPDFILTVDRNGTILALNRTVTGIRVKDTIGRSIYDYAPPNSSETVKKSLERVFRAGKSETFEILGTGPKGPNSACYETRVLPMRRDKQVVAATLICTDITARKKAEESLHKSGEEFRLAFENAKDAIFWADPETGLIINCNKAAESLLEKKKNEIIGFRQTTIHPRGKSQSYSNVFKRHVKQKGACDEDAEVITKSGEIKRVQISASVTLAGGKPIIQGIFRDITERMQMEEALRQSEAGLQKQKLALEQKNIALGEIIKQIEVEKTRIKNDILDNINEIILPILVKLRIKKATRKYVDLLQYHLKELASSFGRKIAERTLRLTSREIEVCSMVKGGLTSKEISDLLSISYQTVEKHRRNIRYKLGIANKGINLTSFLQTL